MRLLSTSRFLLLLFTCISFYSCDEKEEFVTEQLTDYTPMTAGKYITYRVDSTVFTNFGRTTEVHKYQVKHQVDALITDNLGRPSYRVFRFIRDSAGTQSWQPSGSYFVTLLSDQVEVVDDNLRMIKLHLPIRDGFTWRGNRHLPADPYGPLFGFSNDDYMAEWDFYYDGSPSAFSYKGINYTNVISTEQADEAVNIPVMLPGSYGSISRAVDKYAKGIGLVFREFLMWEYQPNTSGPGGPYYTGFGLTMWMIDHN